MGGEEEEEVRIKVMRTRVYQKAAAEDKIFDILRIPLHQWRLSSCGGKLFWDNRKVGFYNVQTQWTVTMRGLLKGSGHTSGKKSGKPLTLANESNNLTKPVGRMVNTIAKRRRSCGLNQKRPRDL